ncbi:zinc finger and BTB domain-containing protein 49 [Polypterus senegalus]
MDTLSSHSCYLLQQLHEQRIQGLFCDCVLVVKGVSFKAHKNVLASFSQYFRTLFQNSSGQKMETFHLDIKNVGGIGQILDFMYTSHLELNHENVQSMLDIAQYLQVPNVLSLCSNFLKPFTSVVESSSIVSENTSFPLPQVAPSDSDSVLDTNTPPEIGQQCGSEAQKQLCTSTSVELSRRLQSKCLNQNQSFETLNSGSVEPEKQISHGLKLRNFYSKQYFKQNPALQGNVNLNPNSHNGIEETFPSNVTEVANTVDITLCSLSNRECNSEISDSLPPGFVVQPLVEATVNQTSRRESAAVSKPVCPKKTVYLKKYNYLRSQESFEDTTVHQDSFSNTQTKDSNKPISGKEVGDADVSHLPIDKDLPTMPSLQHAETSSQESEMRKGNSSVNTSDYSLPQVFQKQYCCEMCGKIFKHPSNLELHKRSHTGEKPFQCNICGKNFSQAGNLQTHLRRHSGEKPYICEICGKSFAASGDVQRHIVIHTGEKPHLCDICGRGFSNFSNLKEHKKTHTSDSMFTCDQCDKSFNMHRKLLKHRVRHTGERPYSCATCGKCFAGSGDLRRHVRTHTGERPYTCETCGKCFTRSAVLRRHKTMHCKTGDGQVLEDLGEVESPYLQSVCQKEHNSEAFSSILPDSSKLPPQTNESGPTVGFNSATSNSFPDLGSIVQPQLISPEGKLCADLVKVPKPHRQNEHFSYEQHQVTNDGEHLQGTNTSMVRQSVSNLDSQCNVTLGSRINSAFYRNNEGPFISSMTLWGLAMKTLQNDSEMEQ